jgi:hypothetical protein
MNTKYNILYFQQQDTELSGGFGQPPSDGGVKSGNNNPAQDELQTAVSILQKTSHTFKSPGAALPISQEEVDFYNKVSSKYPNLGLGKYSEFVKQAHEISNMSSKDKGLAFLESPDYRRSLYSEIDKAFMAKSPLIRMALEENPRLKIGDPTVFNFYVQHGDEIIGSAMSTIRSFADFDFGITDFSLTTQSGSMIPVQASAVSLADQIQLTGNYYEKDDYRNRLKKALSEKRIREGEDYTIKDGVLYINMKHDDKRRADLVEAIYKEFGEDANLWVADGDEFDKQALYHYLGSTDTPTGVLPNGLPHYNGKVKLILSDERNTMHSYVSMQKLGKEYANLPWNKIYISGVDIRFDQGDAVNPLYNAYRSFISAFDNATDLVSNLLYGIGEVSRYSASGGVDLSYKDYVNYMNSINNLETSYYQTEKELQESPLSLYKLLGISGSVAGQIAPALPLALIPYFGQVFFGARLSAAIGTALRSALLRNFSRTLIFTAPRSNFVNLGRLSLLGSKALDLGAHIGRAGLSIGGKATSGLYRAITNPVIMHGAAFAASSSYIEARRMGLSMEAASDLSNIAAAAVIGSEALLGSMLTYFQRKMLGGFSSAQEREFNRRFSEAMRRWIGDVMSSPEASVAAKSTNKLVNMLESAIGKWENWTDETFIGGTIGSAFAEAKQETAEELINIYGRELIEEKYGLSDDTFTYDLSDIFHHITLSMFFGSLPTSAILTGLPNLRKNINSNYRLTRDSNTSLDAFIVSSILDGKTDLLLKAIDKMAASKVFGTYYKGKALPEGFKGDVNDFYRDLFKQQVMLYQATIASIKNNISRDEQYLDNLFDAAIKKIKGFAEATIDAALGERIEALDSKANALANSLKQSMKDKDVARTVLLSAALEHEQRGLAELSAANGIMMILNRTLEPEEQKAVVEHIYKYNNKRYVFNPINKKWELYSKDRHVLLADFDYRKALNSIDVSKLDAEGKALVNSIKETIGKIEAIKANTIFTEIVSMLSMAEEYKKIKGDDIIDASFLSSVYGRERVAKGISSLIDTIIERDGFATEEQVNKLLDIKSKLDAASSLTDENINDALNAVFSLFGQSTPDSKVSFGKLKAALIKEGKIKIDSYAQAVTLSNKLEEQGNAAAVNDPFSAFIYHSLSSTAAVSAVAPYSFSNYVYKVTGVLDAIKKIAYSAALESSFLYDPHLIAGKMIRIMNRSEDVKKALEEEKQKALELLKDIESKIEGLTDPTIGVEASGVVTDEDHAITEDVVVKIKYKALKDELVSKIKGLEAELKKFNNEITSLSEDIDKSIDKFKKSNKDQLIDSLNNTDDIDALASTVYKIKTLFDENELSAEAKNALAAAEKILSDAGVTITDVPHFIKDISKYEVIEEVDNTELADMLPEGEYAVISVEAPSINRGQDETKAKVRVVAGKGEARADGVEDAVDALRKGADNDVLGKIKKIKELKSKVKEVETNLADAKDLLKQADDTYRRYRYYESVVFNLGSYGEVLLNQNDSNELLLDSLSVLLEFNLDEIELPDKDKEVLGLIKLRWNDFLQANPNASFADFYKELANRGGEEDVYIIEYINNYVENARSVTLDEGFEEEEIYKEHLLSLPFFDKLTKAIKLLSGYNIAEIETLRIAFDSIYKSFYEIFSSIEDKAAAPEVKLVAIAEAIDILKNAKEEGNYLSEDGKKVVDEAIEAFKQVKSLLEYSQLLLLQEKLNEPSLNGIPSDIEGKKASVDKRLSELASENNNFEWLDADGDFNGNAKDIVQAFQKKLFVIRYGYHVYKSLAAILGKDKLTYLFEYVHGFPPDVNNFNDEIDPEEPDYSKVVMYRLYTNYINRVKSKINTNLSDINKMLFTDDLLGRLYYLMDRIEKGGFLDAIRNTANLVSEVKSSIENVINSFSPEHLTLKSFENILFLYNYLRNVEGVDVALNVNISNVLINILNGLKLPEIEYISILLDKDYDVVLSNFYLLFYELYKGQGTTSVPPLDIDIFPIKEDDIGQLNPEELLGAIEGVKSYLNMFIRFGIPEHDINDLHSLPSLVTMMGIMEQMINILSAKIDVSMRASKDRSSKIKQFHNTQGVGKGPLVPDKKPATQLEIEADMLEAATDGGLLLKNDRGGYDESTHANMLLSIESYETSTDEKIVVPYGYFKNLLLSYYKDAFKNGKLKFILTSEQEYMLFTLFNSLVKGDTSEVDVIQAAAGSGKTTMIMVLLSLYDLHLQKANQKKTIGVLTAFPRLMSNLQKHIADLNLKNIEVKFIDGYWGQYDHYDPNDKSFSKDNILLKARAHFDKIKPVLDSVDILYIDEMQAVPVEVLKTKAKIIATGDIAQIGISSKLWQMFLINGGAIKSTDAVVAPISNFAPVLSAIQGRKKTENDEYSGKTFVPRILSIRYRAGVLPLLEFLDAANATVSTSNPGDGSILFYIKEVINRAKGLKYAETGDGVLGVKVVDTSVGDQFYKDAASLIKANIEDGRLKPGASFIIYVDDIDAFKKTLSNELPSDIIDMLYSSGYIYDRNKPLNINGIEVDYVYVKVDNDSLLTKEEVNTLFSRARKGVVIGLDIGKDQVSIPGKVSASAIRIIKPSVDPNILGARIDNINTIWKDELVDYGDTRISSFTSRADSEPNEPNEPSEPESQQPPNQPEEVENVPEEGDVEETIEPQAEGEEVVPSQEDTADDEEGQEVEPERPISKDKAEEVADKISDIGRKLDLSISREEIINILNNLSTVELYLDLLSYLKEAMKRKLKHYEHLPGGVEDKIALIDQKIIEIQNEIERICK